MEIKAKGLGTELGERERREGQIDILKERESMKDRHAGRKTSREADRQTDRDHLLDRLTDR